MPTEQSSAARWQVTCPNCEEVFEAVYWQGTAWLALYRHTLVSHSLPGRLWRWLDGR